MESLWVFVVAKVLECFFQYGLFVRIMRTAQHQVLERQRVVAFAECFHQAYQVVTGVIGGVVQLQNSRVFRSTFPHHAVVGKIKMVDGEQLSINGKIGVIQGRASVCFTYCPSCGADKILLAVHSLGKTVRSSVDYLQAARVAAFPGQGVKRIFIPARCNGSRGGHNAYGNVFFRVDIVQRGVDTGVDDSNSFDARLALVQIVADVFQTVSRCCVTGNHQGFDLFSQQEEGIFHNQFSEKIRLVFCRVIAVRHISLVAQVNVIFPGEQFTGQDGFQYGQSSRTGIEYANGQFVSGRRVCVKICVKDGSSVIQCNLYYGQLLLRMATGKYKEACQKKKPFHKKKN